MIRVLEILILLAVSMASYAQAQDKSVKIIVPFTAGGSTDVLSREFAQALGTVLNQPVVVDNRAGGDGAVGVQAASKSAPDGYTALVGTNSTQVLNVLLNRTVPYDPVKDFAPVCMLGRSKNVMYIRSSLPHKTLAEFLADAKAQPEKFTFAYVSAGTRLAAELLQQLGTVRLRGIPYRSTAGAFTDVAGGQVDVLFSDHVSAIPFLQTGKIRALAVTGSERVKAIPEVPTMIESGLKSYEMQPWYALYLPIQTPRPMVEKLIDASTRAISSPAMQAAREKLGVDEFLVCDAELAKFQLQEIARWGRVVKDANIQPQ
ncbi:Bug family tripartite tricarboxylate transporter substrate binding protein [Variovorax saccharolyticus]|uniref:Bug family tripartite tricarboxylate transporter substrate binding protein n=1 Tax=Variovorax saccharolyticus TaxID=3053516 RepID=UPI0025765484|nr:tripartite tricarboxylate transporter substrate binding protein [Variovorax sp. J22R187]MDM0022243.1 tripartite tricarboxylate transporter substrate binding protein [Variovorax sp. J22R187]